jgi:hypothetical protein
MKNERYSPDPNGYFVCKTKLLITNINLCKHNKNRDKTSIPEDCSKCKLNLKLIKKTSLENIEDLEIELNTYIDSDVKFSNPEFFKFYEVENNE